MAETMRSGHQEEADLVETNTSIGTCHKRLVCSSDNAHTAPPRETGVRSCRGERVEVSGLGLGLGCLEREFS